MRMILLGNAGAGKSTMARRLISDRPIPRLSLDEIAWNPGPERKPLNESITLLLSFIQDNQQWVIEGCYADIIEAALPYCTELRFLNPGIATCIDRCYQRPWEPEKFASPQEQQAMLQVLVDWVKEYETRSDEYGLSRHRALYDQFCGEKQEFTHIEQYYSELI
ncbi:MULTISPECIES: hypothetical protein [unclassified Roseofilum]|uniref:hypothetical protein n=1 Tax=unclassified Roseofilum TaxID=2620099 RepID=UPI000E98E304|nr:MULTISPECIES: hypothetical protein [unclassified Roseofilum]MBP0011083.1 shikimate kinase [Roseofilum sp. Belize Diploria]MBP0035269.1 shikimate kinase [Roseofilum sp. Belize BBD 4]HBQ98991.1 shikimate kinase [Cyanobacteria bacterium UBA11691]